MLSFKPAFLSSSLTLKRLFSYSSLSAFRVVSSAYMSLKPSCYLIYTGQDFLTSLGLNLLIYKMGIIVIYAIQITLCT